MVFVTVAEAAEQTRELNSFFDSTVHIAIIIPKGLRRSGRPMTAGIGCRSCRTLPSDSASG